MQPVTNYCFQRIIVYVTDDLYKFQKQQRPLCSFISISTFDCINNSIKKLRYHRYRDTCWGFVIRRVKRWKCNIRKDNIKKKKKKFFFVIGHSSPESYDLYDSIILSLSKVFLLWKRSMDRMIQNISSDFAFLWNRFNWHWPFVNRAMIKFDLIFNLAFKCFSQQSKFCLNLTRKRDLVYYALHVRLDQTHLNSSTSSKTLRNTW